MRSLNLCVGGIDLVAMIAERDGEDMVAVRPICDALELDWKTQHKKLVRNELVRATNMSLIATDGNECEMLCIPVRNINRWVYSIKPKELKKEYSDAHQTLGEELQDLIYSTIKGQVPYSVVSKIKKFIHVASKYH
jgi:hypothetical protein